MTDTVFRAKNVRTAVLMRNDVKIDRDRLAELERKERAHDAYLRAIERMQGRSRDIQDSLLVGHTRFYADFHAGWLAALAEFSQYVAEEDA